MTRITTSSDLGMATDPRSPFQKLRRVECARLLEKHNVNFDRHLGKEALIKLLEGHNISPYEIEWTTVVRKDEQGNPIVQKHVKRKLHQSASQDVNSTGILAKKLEEQAKEQNEALTEENESLKDQVEELRAQIDRLIEMQSREEVQVKPEVKPKEPQEMKLQELRAHAKKIGIKCPPGMKKAEILEAVINHGQDIPASSPSDPVEG